MLTKQRESAGREKFLDSRLRRTFTAIVVAVFAFIGLGSWALASPVGASPDDDYHLVSIWCSWGEREDLCEPGSMENTRMVPRELVERVDCLRWDATSTAACSITDDFVETSRGDFRNNYAPIYYRAMAAFVSEDVGASTITIRLMNAAIFVTVITTLLTLLPRGQRGALFWSLVVGLVPLGVFIVPSINPSSWAVLAGLTIWVALTGYIRSPTFPKMVGFGIIAVGAAVLGGGARGDAGIYMVIAAGVAAILTFDASKSWLKKLGLPIVIVALGVVFFLQSENATSYAGSGIQRVQELSEPVDGAVAITEVSSVSWDLILQNLMHIPSLWAGSLGTWGIGWFEWELPRSIPVIMVGAFSALAFLGLRKLTWQKTLTLGLLLIALVLIPSYILYGIGAYVGVEVQPRYLLPLVLISIGVALYGLNRDDLGLTPPQALVLLAGVSFANALSLHNTLRRYLTGIHYQDVNLNRNISWWWLDPVPSIFASPLMVWAVGSLAFGLALLLGYLLLRSSPSPQDEADLEAGGVKSDTFMKAANGLQREFIQTSSDARNGQ